MPLARVEPPEDVVLYHVFPPNCVYFCSSSLSYKTGRIVASETCQHTSKMIATHPSRKESWNMLSAESGFFSQVTGKHLRIHCIGIQFIAARVLRTGLHPSYGFISNHLKSKAHIGKSHQSQRCQKNHALTVSGCLRSISTKPPLSLWFLPSIHHPHQVLLALALDSTLGREDQRHHWVGLKVPLPHQLLVLGWRQEGIQQHQVIHRLPQGRPQLHPSAPCEGPAWKRVKDRGRIMLFFGGVFGAAMLIDRFKAEGRWNIMF